MIRTWTFAAAEAEAMARALEAHLNEFAEEVISVSYAVTDKHHVLAVYRGVEMLDEDSAAVAVEIAEQLVEDAQA